MTKSIQALNHFTPPQFSANRRWGIGRARACFLVACVTLSLSTAHAEFRVGVELSPTRSATGVNYSLPSPVVNGSHRDIDTSIGVFGQYRHAISPSIAIGIHLAYRQDDSVYRDYQFVHANQFVNFTVSADNAYEVLGFVARHGKAVNPFVMLGVRQVETESLLRGKILTIVDVQQSSEDELTGWTFAAGVEMPLAQNWFAQMAVQYTDYGEEIETTQTGGAFSNPVSIDFDLQQTGLRFALGYAF